ncbi:Uncharacterized protein HZ326_29624 [Fusarium oxysporum f. sp. albedinis]|nr:Uncharacterized protein HZ326_29624 [Fusarium oxysporum f. sp. albedinis]
MMGRIMFFVATEETLRPVQIDVFNKPSIPFEQRHLLLAVHYQVSSFLICPTFVLLRQFFLRHSVLTTRLVSFFFATNRSPQSSFALFLDSILVHLL